MKTLQEKQQGFTLIEIAIVLVIIGLPLHNALSDRDAVENREIETGHFASC